MSFTLSVITICYNNLLELIDTCDSVDAQSVAPQEHLIIDGSSNEEILNWLTHNEQPPYRRWIHERDNGISDAFNKGVTKAKYEVVQMLNSGDCYYGNKAIETVKAYFEADPKLKWCNASFIQHRGGTDVKKGDPFDPKLVWKGMRTINHQTMFVRKELHDKHGLYDTNLKVAMDYDFVLRIRNEKHVFIPDAIAYFAPEGISNTNYRKGYKEVRAVYKKHVGDSIMPMLWQVRQILLNEFTNSKIGSAIFRSKNKRNRV